MQLMAMPLTSLPLCLLPSHYPRPFVQQWVATEVQVPLGGCDPTLLSAQHQTCSQTSVES